jgi:hypothetical protein
MTKTPEEMAEEYAWKHYGYSAINHQLDFLAGYQAAKDEMNSSNNSNGWISVKERLPEESTHCVIRIDDGEYQVAWREDGHWIMFNPCCIYNSQLNNVTHWMPLPKPPEDK